MIAWLQLSDDDETRGRGVDGGSGRTTHPSNEEDVEPLQGDLRDRGHPARQREAPKGDGLCRFFACAPRGWLRQEAPKPHGAERRDDNVWTNPGRHDCERPPAEGERRTDEDHLERRPQETLERHRGTNRTESPSPPTATS